MYSTSSVNNQLLTCVSYTSEINNHTRYRLVSIDIITQDYTVIKDDMQLPIAQVLTNTLSISSGSKHKIEGLVVDLKKTFSEPTFGFGTYLTATYFNEGQPTETIKHISVDQNWPNKDRLYDIKLANTLVGIQTSDNRVSFYQYDVSTNKLLSYCKIKIDDVSLVATGHSAHPSTTIQS